MQTGFTLSSALVNDYILSDTIRQGGSQFTDVLRDSDIGSEIVHYVVLQTPSINITDGTASEFSMIGKITAHAAVLPSMKNLLLYRTFDPVWEGKQRKQLDMSFRGEIGSPVIDGKQRNFLLPPPRTAKETSKFLDKLVDVSNIDNSTTALSPSAVGVTFTSPKAVREKKALEDLLTAYSSKELSVMIKDTETAMLDRPPQFLPALAAGAMRAFSLLKAVPEVIRVGKEVIGAVKGNKPNKTKQTAKKGLLSTLASDDMGAKLLALEQSVSALLKNGNISKAKEKQKAAESIAKTLKKKA